MQKQVRKKLVTLSLTGRMIHLCANVTENVKATIIPDGFDWGNTIADAVILSGITFFGTIGGTAYVGVAGKDIVIAGLIAAGSQFFAVLALKRGLVKKEDSKS
jgi:hypothetical protein